MTDPAFQAGIDELAKQLADLQTGIQPGVTQQPDLVTTITALQLELAAVSSIVSAGHTARITHAECISQRRR